MMSIALSASGCGDDDDNNVPRDASTDASRDAAADSGRDASNDNDASHDNDSGLALSDGEIVQALQTIHSGEIELGQLALTRSQNTQVDALASDIVSDHTSALAALETLADDRDIDPMQSAVSVTLTQTTNQTRAVLEGYSGANFDLAYANAVVVMHSNVLNLIDERLLPDADDLQLRATLTTTRASVTTHLEHGQHLLDMLEPDASSL